MVLENLYSYGPTGGRTLTEDLPAHATSAKAATRIEMTNELLEAHRQGALDVTIGRASDFFGPRVTQSALGEQVMRPALTGKRAQVMGKPAMPHSYSYAPDVAKGLIALGTAQATSGQIWHLPDRRDAHHHASSSTPSTRPLGTRHVSPRPAASRSPSSVS